MKATVEQMKFWVESVELLIAKGMTREDAEDQLLILLTDIKEEMFTDVK